MEHALHPTLRKLASALACICLAASLALPSAAWAANEPYAQAAAAPNAAANTATATTEAERDNAPDPAPATDNAANDATNAGGETDQPRPAAADSAPAESSSLAAEPAPVSQSGTVTIMHTNDMHGRYAADSKGTCIGLSALKALKDQVDPSLLLDAGDTFHGLSFATVQEGESIARLMDKIGYDATTPGNHDWSYGAARLKQIDSAHAFSVLGANVLSTDGSAYFKNPYLIKEVKLANGNSIKVGVVGVIDQGFYTSTAAKNVAGVQFSNPVAYANDTALKLKASKACDLVIALTHNRDPKSFAAQTTGIDAVVAGHEHIVMDATVLNKNGVQVPVVEAGCYLGNVGLLTLNVERDAPEGAWRVTGHTEKTYSPANTAGMHDAEVDALVKSIEDNEATVLNEKIGTSTQEYPFSWEDIRTADQALGHAVTAAYLSATQADIALENAGGIRGGIPQGTVTAGDMLSISPYGNTLVTYALSGADVRAMLEHSLEISAQCSAVYEKQKAAEAAGQDPYQYAWPENSGSVLVQGGITMTVDWSKPAGQRIASATVKGAALDDARTYTVVTNSYIPSLTDEYPNMATAAPLEEFGTCEQALRDFVSQSTWESQVYQLSGTVTYAAHDNQKQAQDAIPAAQQCPKKSALAATGDGAAQAAQATAALAGLAAALAAGAFVGRKPLIAHRRGAAANQKTSRR